MSDEEFVEAVGWLFEASPWVAERAAKHRPFASIEAMHAEMVRQVEQASHAEQLALLRAHPDLGTRARVSDASASEQHGAGLGSLTAEEFDLFTRLNNSYKERFRFPFIYAVKGSTKHDILNAMQARLRASVDEEFAEALRQVYRIAAFRSGELNGAVRRWLEE